MVGAVKRRYWVNVRQTAHMQKMDTTSVTAPTLAAAEGRAVALLRVARLTKVDGALWDRWEVKTAGSPHSLPQLVAYGDVTHTLYTRRDHGWAE